MEILKNYVNVRTKTQLKELYDYITSPEHTIIAVDTETDSLNVRKGRIIGWSVSANEGEGYYFPTLVWNTQTETLEKQYIEGEDCEVLSKKLLGMLVGKRLITHNGSFDCRFIKHYYGVNLIDSIWVDTTLLVHTVQEEGAGMGVFGLKPLAISIQEEIGLDVEKAANEEQKLLKESIKKNGGSTSKLNFEIYKADLDILAEYGAADTDLTLRVCNYFLKKLKEENLEQFFFEDEVMPIYREVTIPMEDAGVDLDMDLIRKTKEDIERDLQINKEIVIKSIMATSEAKKWVLDTSQNTYPPNHKGTWAQYLAQRYSLDLPKSEKTGKYSLTQKNIEELEDSPAKQFLLTGDVSVLDPVEVARISLQLWKDDNEGEYLNIQSKKHLGEIVFKYMGVEAQSQTKKGADQFDQTMIEELSKEYTWAENLRVYNKLLKIRSTYVDRFLENSEDGRYYFYFKQHGTVSGRYGSDAQQLPKPKEEDEDVEIVVHYNNLVRAFIIAGEGRKFIDADYTSLEPHCFASVTGDENLQEIFNKGWDFYSTIAIRTEKLDQDTKKYPNGISPDTKSPVFLKKLDPVKRNTAKGYALGVPYGMGPFALSKTLEVSLNEAERLINGYLDGFPNLKNWMESSRAQVKAHGYIRNYVGRIRHLPTVAKVYAKFGDKLLDWKFKRELESRFNKKDVLQLYRDYKNGLNNCLNYQLQSLAASIVNRSALSINRKLRELGYDALCVLQVHDQLVVNVPEEYAEELCPIVQEIMENVIKLPGVTLKAPPEIANNLRDGH